MNKIKRIIRGSILSMRYYKLIFIQKQIFFALAYNKLKKYYLNMKRLPIGIQTFSDIIENNYYYIDKTEFIKKLLSGPKSYFLSRPRRFGKSLFLDTIESAFRCKKDLFKGLYLENNWDWESEHPVVKISFGSGVSRNIEELRETFNYSLHIIEQEYSIETTFKDLKNRFSQIIELLYKKYSKQVVVLIDEYDKPILDNITKTELAEELRDELKNYYSVIKDSDRYIKLCFITGVSKFSKVNLFSGLNNLNDITLDKEYGDVCGYNQQELESIFSDRLKNFDKEKVKKWYNGYSFTGKSVYNPFDILFLFEKKEFRNYWFETGTPSFLIKLISERNFFIPNLENIETSDKIIGSFDVDDIVLEALLFQTGYLTIKKKIRLGENTLFYLTYPNMEVKISLTDYILGKLVESNIKKSKNHISLYKAMENGDLEKLKDIFHSFFASIPSDWYRKNTIANYEGYYSSIFYCYMTALGLDVIPEDVTNQGRIDLTAKIEDNIYIMEFKVIEMVKDKNTAFNQIKDKKYHEKYLTEGKKVYILGVEFSKETRNITGYEWELVN